MELSYTLTLLISALLVWSFTFTGEYAPLVAGVTFFLSVLFREKLFLIGWVALIYLVTQYVILGLMVDVITVLAIVGAGIYVLGTMPKRESFWHVGAVVIFVPIFILLKLSLLFVILIAIIILVFKWISIDLSFSE